MNKALFTSDRDDWETPKKVYDLYNRRYHFKLDAAASAHNTKAEFYFDKEIDSFTQDWYKYKTVWLNPPYGRGVLQWVRKAYIEAMNGALVVMLLAARTDTKWFHEYCVKGEIHFIRGRLKFGGAKDAAPFPSMLVIFDGRKRDFKNEKNSISAKSVCI